MTTFGQNLNNDAAGVKTSATYGDDGSGTSRWHLFSRLADGANVALGKRSDAAVANPASSGSLIALVKGLLGIRHTEDSAAASADVGVAPLAVRRDDPGTDIVDADGDYIHLVTDDRGQLRTAPSIVQVASTSALASALEVKATAGVLHGLVGYVDDGADGWLQVFDLAGGAPTGGTIPVVSYSVAASAQAQPVQIAFPGLACASGIVVAWSTTGASFTAPGDEPMFITASYE